MCKIIEQTMFPKIAEKKELFLKFKSVITDLIQEISIKRFPKIMSNTFEHTILGDAWANQRPGFRSGKESTANTLEKMLHITEEFFSGSFFGFEVGR